MSVDGQPRVTVLCHGILVREGVRVVDASSTVTLVEHRDRRIVVDTGSPLRVERLTRALRSSSVDAASVDTVVNTHMHVDHIGGNDLFTNARFHAHRLEEPPAGTASVEEGTFLTERVRVMETPGHTAGSVTVVVEGERTYAICGDALPTRSNYESSSPPALHIDRRLAVESMERILEVADVVVPGHDGPFAVLGKR